MTTRNALQAGAFTALWTFLAVFGLSLTGWLTDVANWAADSSGAVVFPDPRVLVKALVSGVVAAASGFVGLVVRLSQAKGVIGGSAPSYHRAR